MSGDRNTNPRVPRPSTASGAPGGGGILHGRGTNTEEPNIMHIDLNSCFATVEQQ